ncbi:MAG: uracil phosphoribosyltransferase [Andreesenia angusta]|nr:uracil phosphoribosyltransferase [Andreesenia angusta]
MGKTIIMEHPLIEHKIAILKNRETGSKLFRELIDELGMLMAVEVTKDLKLKVEQISTPLMDTEVKMIDGKKLILVPILRAGIGMVDGFLNMLPSAKVGHIGLYREPETLEPVEYFCKLPKDTEDREIIILDPMLATGGSAEAAVRFVKERFNPKKISVACIIGCPEGLNHLREKHSDIDIYIAYMDEKLNEHGYILPGLGDAGDRLFGTKQ